MVTFKINLFTFWCACIVESHKSLMTRGVLLNLMGLIFIRFLSFKNLCFKQVRIRQREEELAVLHIFLLEERLFECVAYFDEWIRESRT